MRILLTENISENGYIESLVNAYKKLGHEVCCDVSNFFYSNVKFDVLHIHWPERLYRWFTVKSIDSVNIYELIKIRLEWYKQNKTRVVYTIHNIVPHEKESHLDNEIFGLVIEYADILVHHCESSISLFKNQYGNKLDLSRKKHIVCRHGDYLIHYKSIQKLDAREKYKIPLDKLVTINFGTQRPYKNEKFLLDVFDNVDFKKKYLLIAGEYSYPANHFRKTILQVKNKIRKYSGFSDKKFIYKYFQINELPYILGAADLAFLAQTEALNSGFISLAATYSIPLVIPDIGCFKEAAEGWVYRTYKPGNVQDAILALSEMHDILSSEPTLSNQKWLAGSTWYVHANNILEQIES